MEETSARSNWAFDLALALLAPFFFLSLFLGILAPLPLLYLHQGHPNRFRSRFFALIAGLFGIALCFWIRGAVGAAGFFIYAALPALLLGEMLELWKKPGIAVLGAVTGTFCATAIVLFLFAKSAGQDPLAFTEQQIAETVRAASQKLLENPKDLPKSISEDDLKRIVADPRQVLTEVPGMYVAALLFLCAIPVAALIRWNPKGFTRRLEIKRDYMRQWRTPDWLVWPALACGAFLIFEVKTLSSFANNLLKPILVLYFFQGMSILSFFMDVMRFKGPIRAILYGLGLIFLTPMLISFGFFDLWFNFRTRVRKEQE